MPRFIPSELLEARLADFVVLDVRKAPARVASGKTIAGSQCRAPFDVEGWWPEFKGRRVVVFCVHGHEVSQGVCRVLTDHGVEAFVLAGGFSAWEAASLPVEPVGGEP